MIDKYVGIPYKFNGRDIFGLDCYGLVWLVEKDVWGKHLPRLDGIEDGDRAELFAEHRALIDGVQTTEPDDGDVVVLFLHDVPQHVGVYYRNGVLHATDTRGVVYEKLNSRYMQRFNKKEFYRV